MIEVTYDSALRALRECVDERGEDFIYEPPLGLGTTCLMQHNDQPSCGVGLALFKLGVTVPQLALAEGGIEEAREVLEGNDIATFEQEAVDLLSTFQFEQDSSRPWGEALYKALQQNPEQ